MKKKRQKKTNLGKAILVILSGGYEVIGSFAGETDEYLFLDNPCYLTYKVTEIYREAPMVQFIRLAPFASGEIIPIKTSFILSCVDPVPYIEECYREDLKSPQNEAELKGLLKRARDEFLKEQLEQLSAPSSNTAGWH